MSYLLAHIVALALTAFYILAAMGVLAAIVWWITKPVRPEPDSGYEAFVEEMRQ